MARFRFVQALLLSCEFAISAASVVLFGLAYPDRFRSKLWENGGELRWNSNPRLRIYFYANYREPPEIPLIWSQRQVGYCQGTRCDLLTLLRLTTSNLAISILTLVVFLTRAIMSRLDYLPLYGNVLYDILLLTLWAASVTGQCSGGYSDPEHSSMHPWYLAYGCTESTAVNRGYCHVAQASFVLSVLAVLLYGSRLSFYLWTVVCDGGKERQFDSISEDESKELLPGMDAESVSDSASGAGWYKQPLSPVLAFFPEKPNP
ncbi:Uncharacterized protein TPAR_06230 [Tolypocladium paradoxum]|uniref:MARVEL domain-containing protein n=1 Tax=Tolypocladium paradoxum TaxID=94208 RepID=A0A2S4KTR2_9HYPO|nr:Uncharacterized protein TPAR_06230 [Tolypocladium paradoxum]